MIKCSTLMRQLEAYTDFGRALFVNRMCTYNNKSGDIFLIIADVFRHNRKSVKLSCAIGDDAVDGRPYAEIVEIARNYIRSVGGFEKFAEWGLV